MKKKRILRGITAAAIATAAMTLVCSGSAFASVTGDATGDGSFNVADVVSFCKYLTAQGDIADATAADMNGDGKLNAVDLTLMKRALLNTATQPDDPVEPPVTADDTYVTQITFASGSVTLKNANDQVVDAASAQNVKVENGTYVTVTKPTTDGTTDFGDINVDGECTNGQLKVDVDATAYATGQVTFNLRGLTLSNSSDSPIYIAQIADECVITVKKDTVNTISDGSSYTNADESAAAIYSLDDLKFKGKGTLIVKGNCGDGIVSKDDLKIWNGDIQVTAVDDGIRGKDSIRIGDPDDTDYADLKLTVSAAGDAIKSTNDTADSGKGYIKINGGTVSATSTNGDAIQAQQAIEINGGDITVKTSGSTNSTSAKGIKGVGLYDTDETTLLTGATITVNGGMITADTTDDCIHASGAITLNAGKLKLTTTDDAVHSDNELYVGGTTAGTDYTSLEVYVTACYEGFEAYKIYQNNGNIYIIAKDDGFNAAGGADGSGNSGSSQNPWQQGGWGPGGGGSSYGEMNLNGGIVSVNTSFQDADGFDSNGPLVFNGGYYFGNGGDSFDCGDGSSITYNGGYAFGGLGMGGGSGYNMSTQMVFADASGNVLASSMSGGNMTYAYGSSNVQAYSGAQVSNGTNISTLGQPAVYISGQISGGTALTLGQGGSGQQPGGPGQNPWG